MPSFTSPRDSRLAWRFALLALVLSAPVLPAFAASPDSAAIRIQKLSAPPKLEDFLGGRVPDGMTPVTGFRQREPEDGQPASRETKAFLGYDDQNFYAVFLCKEDPAKVRARMSKRENIMGDDVVGVILDTFHDHHRAYEFLVNPLGIQLDGITSAGQEDDFSFDTLWHSEGRLTPDGYAVLMAIPFRSLRFSGADVQEWGIALARILPLHNETSFWPYMTKNINGFHQQMATLTGLERITAGRNIQLIPYGDFTGARFLDETNGAYDRSREGRAGLDAKMVIQDAFTLDLAVKPDFSQVESDEPQVTINQRFEVQFPEKRPFFIENANYFNTGETLFFSRRISDPQLGARITGKVGRWAVGALVMDDKGPGEQVGEGEPGRGDRAVVAVARVAREFGNESAIGAMVTSRDFGSGSNRVGSVDLRFHVGKNVSLQAQVIGSRTTDMSGHSQDGHAYRASLDYSSRTFSASSTYKDRSADFHTDLGFVPRVDIRQWENEVGYKFFPKKSRLLSWGPALETSVIWDQSNRLQEWEVSPEIETEFPASTQVHTGYSRSYELFEGIGFRKHNARVFMETEWLKWLSGSLSGSIGQAINYYPGSGLLPFLGSTRSAEAGLTFRPAPALRIEETYIYESLKTRDANAFWAAGDSIFSLHLWRTKANYQFTRELSLRAIIDYNVVLPNERLVNLEHDKRFTLDLLGTYLLNPGTALYIGVTDAYANLKVDPRYSPALQRIDRATTSTGRQFFVKVSYLLRY